MQAHPAQSCDDLKKLIREVPDFPKPGILFYDITTLLKDKLGFARLIDALTERYINDDVDLVLGHRGPWIHLRSSAGLPPERRLRAGSQAEEAAGRSVAVEVRPGIRTGHAGDPQGRDPARTAGSDL